MTDTARPYQPMSYRTANENLAWERARAGVRLLFDDAKKRLQRARRASAAERKAQEMAVAEIAFRAGYRVGLAQHAWSVALGEGQNVDPPTFDASLGEDHDATATS